VADGHPLSQADFDRLDPAQRADLDQRSEEVSGRVATTVRQMHQLEKEAAERVARLDDAVARFAVGPLFEELREHYHAQPDVLDYVQQVQNDLPQHLADFRPTGAQDAEATTGTGAFLDGLGHDGHLGRYRVNVLIDNGSLDGAPVVIERNPTYYNLAGRIDYRATYGAMVTDFHQIKPGALHRANGGFLVLHIADVLQNPFAWDLLKRALRSREIRIDGLADQQSLLPTATLRPQPIPLDLKVVLIGSPSLYALLYNRDDDVPELFKVRADFAPEMAWTDEHVHNYAAFISQCVRDAGLRHFERSAVARVVEYGARLREHQHRLSTRLLDISDLLTEASFWAGKAGHECVTAADVDQAVAKKEYRANLAEERVHEMIAEGTLMIDTAGARVGQVNGLSIVDLGGHAFGLPARVTAQVALGRGNVQSIEREIKLSGPIHAKGVLILSGYLAATYAQEWPLALGATLTFEQSYDEVEGDSASSTELYALLSALAGLPLTQEVAVTGSVNQHGEVQAVGGVTRKVEGFFAVCQARGLSGTQGVLIPAANVQHLMLSDEVVAAVRDGRFHLWAVRTIDAGIALLTGRPAGERGPDGHYPEGSVHRLVEERLRTYAGHLRSYTAGSPGPNGAAAPEGDAAPLRQG
jgi:lon-related putative ATP-dependent protease